MLKILQARLQHYRNWELPDVQAGFRKGRGTIDQIANIHWIIEKAREFQKKTSTSALLTMPKPLTVWIITNFGKFFKTREPEHINHLLRNLYASQEATVRTRPAKMTGSKLGKEYLQAVYCHPAYLTYVQSLGWMKHKLELSLLGEIPINSDLLTSPPLWLKAKSN